MPRRRTRKRTRFNRKRRRASRRRGLAAKVAKNSRVVRKLRLSQEIKHRELVTHNGELVDNVGVITPICNLALAGALPAAGEVYRTSAEVMLKYVRVTFAVRTGQAIPGAADTYNEYRLLIVRRKVKHNSDPPAFSDLFMSISPHSVYQRTDKEKLAKWAVEYDSGMQTIGKYGSGVPARKHVAVLKNIRNHYTGQDNLPASMKAGQLYIMMLSSSAALPHPYVSTFTQFSFESI